MKCSVCGKKEIKFIMGDVGSLVASYYCSKTCIANRTIKIHNIKRLKQTDGL